MDADDVCYPERLERQLNYLAEHPDCVAVGTGALLVDEQRLRIRPLEQASEHEEIESRFMVFTVPRGTTVTDPFFIPDISSSDVRKRLQSKKLLNNLLTPNVARYIVDHDLYA